MSISNVRRFTLIELLVVISIIAILASMLMPALGAAKEQAKKATCVNQMKQIGSADSVYATDYRTYAPSYVDNCGKDKNQWWWFTFLLGMNNNSASFRKVLLCPVQKTPSKHCSQSEKCGLVYNTYAINNSIYMRDANKNRFIPPEKIRHPSYKYFKADYCDTADWSQYGYFYSKSPDGQGFSGDFGLVHSRACNILFADLHVVAGQVTYRKIPSWKETKKRLVYNE